MMALAVAARPDPALIRVPAVASSAIRGLLSGPETPATILGASSYAVWFLLGDDVVVASTRDSSRLPNSVEVASDADGGDLENVRDASNAVIGEGHIVAGNLEIAAVRWWDPKPALPPMSRRSLGAAIQGLPATVTGVDHARLRTAMRKRSSVDLTSAAVKLIGRGPGLTPEGDDYLAGGLAAVRLLGSAVGSVSTVRMLDAAADEISRLAHRRTTAFSAALIDHALRGDVAASAGAFLRALAGRGAVGASHRELLRVGHSSGPALAAGIVLGAQVLTTTRRIGGM